MNSKVSKDAPWQGYAAAVPDDQAVIAFTVRFGHLPLELRRNGGGVLVGPLTGAEVESKKNGGQHGS